MLEEAESLPVLLKGQTRSALLQQSWSDEMVTHGGFLAAPQRIGVWSFETTVPLRPAVP